MSSRGAVSTFKAHSHPPTPSSEGPSHPGQGRNCQMLCLPADCFGEQGGAGWGGRASSISDLTDKEIKTTEPCTASANSEVQRATLSSEGRFQCPKGTYPEFKLTPLGGGIANQSHPPTDCVQAPPRKLRRTLPRHTDTRDPSCWYLQLPPPPPTQSRQAERISLCNLSSGNTDKHTGSFR